METDINLINKYFILNYNYQRMIFICLIFLVISLSLFNLYFFKKPLTESSKQLNNMSKIILEEDDILEINWLNKNLISFNINSWHNIIEDLIGDIAFINSIHFINKSWEIRGELISIEDYQILYTRINELRQLNFKVNINRVGSLQNSSFLLQLKAGDDS